MDDTNQLTSTQKAAAILVAMGKERAAKLLVHFQPHEIRKLMLASEGLQNIPPERLDILIDEFEGECSNGVGLLDSADIFQSIVEEALTPEELKELIEGPGAAQIALKKKSIWELLDRIEQEDLIEFLMQENAQVSAYILSKLAPKKAASIIGKLGGKSRAAIVAGMITTRAPRPEAIDMLEGLVKKTFGRAIGATKVAGNQRLVAGMFNELDQDLSESIFEELSTVIETKQLQSVKSLMFRFEDIIHLDSAGQAALFDQIPTDTTALALRAAAPDLTEVILAALGQRTRRMLESDLKSESTSSSEDIKEAQKEIANVALSLSATGALKIPERELAA